jgi:hypothetical protein
MQCGEPAQVAYVYERLGFAHLVLGEHRLSCLFYPVARNEILDKLDITTISMVKKKSTTKDPSITVRTLRVRLKDKHAGLLKHQSGEVNMVWNFTQELCLKHLQRTGKFMSAFDVAA